ncbi:MAG: hypothetical protein D6685_07575 [Bacteroidetes bacterium]|nr:MAG: hypothetical protein D6685_07575 [Bacteroidota bacterium]
MPHGRIEGGAPAHQPASGLYRAARLLPVLGQIVLLGLTAFPAAAQSKVGTTAAAFLEVGVGARNVGMGESVVATVDDVTAMYWNPAGLVGLTGGQVGFQYTEWFAGTALQYAAGALGLGRMGTVGVHINLMDSGEMEVTTLEFEDGTGETFRVQDLALGLSYARRLTNTFSLGGTLKYVRSRVWRMAASALALDLGVQYDTPFDHLRLGFSISNFGGEMQLAGDNTTVRVDLDPQTSGDNDGILAQLQTRSWDLPLLFRIGVAYDLLRTRHSSLTLTTDVLYPNNNQQYLNLGAEFGFRGLLFLRGGYTNLFLPDAYGQGHLRLGFGLNLVGILRADYAFADRGDLGSVNVIGAVVQF